MWVRSPWSQQIPDGEHFFKVGNLLVKNHDKDMNANNDDDNNSNNNNNNNNDDNEDDNNDDNNIDINNIR